jgi:hypothetical protein
MSVTPLLTACETITSGNETTHTLDVGKIKRYAQAGLNAAATITSILAMNPGFAVFIAPVRVAADVLNNSLNSFVAATGDKVTIGYDDTSFTSLVNTLADDLDKILTIISSVTVAILKDNLGLESNIVNKVILAKDALATLVSLFKVLIGGFISTASGPNQSLSEREALAILKA